MIERCETCKNYGKCYVCDECDEGNMFEAYTLEEMFQLIADNQLPSNFKVFDEDGKLTEEANKYYYKVGETFFETMDEFDEYFDVVSNMGF